MHGAFKAWQQALKYDTASPSTLLRAASSCADLLISQRSYEGAKPILLAAVRLLPMLSPRILQRKDQQFGISQFANITSRAVSLCLADGDDPYKTLQLCELGRGILANTQLELRSDISLLAAHHPDLAQRFQDLRNLIDPPSKIWESSTIDTLSIPNSTSTLQFAAAINSQRRAHLKEFDDLVQFIHSLPGYEDFLQGPSKAELHSLVEYGTIVLLNVSDIRSDAFLITTEEIRCLRLPLLTPESLEKFTERFLSAVNRRSMRGWQDARLEVNAVLEWLWDVAVDPILNELGFTQMPSKDDPWERIWWIGNGLLSLLPLHAAGYHESTPLNTAIDRVISSYAPTIKSLSYARERAARSDRQTPQEKAVLISMPTTPDKKPLPYVEKEVRDVESLLSMAFVDTRVMENPRKSAIPSALPGYTIVHFACHGNTAHDPSGSHFLLEDLPLTVSDIVSLNIEWGRFAYLSACHTSGMRKLRLLDESINLSSAIQLSGYPSVIGSLWSVTEEHSAKVARDVYRWILREKGGLDAQKSAEGLHKAVRGLRDSTRFMTKQDPLIWAPFIHVGI